MIKLRFPRRLRRTSRSPYAGQSGLQIELGCGQNKRAGFIGIDKQRFPDVDVVMDLNTERLPFDDDSVDYVYTSHAFEHIQNYHFVLQEIFRVCQDMATVEIWTPYGKSNDAFLFGHDMFFTETHFKHICYEYDRFYLGESQGYFDWYATHYNLYPAIAETLTAMSIPMDFALEHMFNIALEWGVFMHVRKDANHAPGPQVPEKRFFYGREQPVLV